MSVRPLPAPPAPAATAVLARVVFPAGRLAMRLRDEPGEVVTNGDFTGGYPCRGGPALSLATLALVSVLQYAERLTDRRAAHAAAARVEANSGLEWLAEVPAVALLRRVWEQQYVRDARRGVRQRTGKELPPGAQRIVSPYDPDARVGIKRSTRWDGYKLHLTETADADGRTPHLITHVATTTAPVDDAALTLPVEQHLAAVGRAPAEHLVDAGYMGAELIVEAAHLGIDLVGPVPIAGGRQDREHRGYALGDFTIDWDAHTATCPQGKRLGWPRPGSCDHVRRPGCGMPVPRRSPRSGRRLHGLSPPELQRSSYDMVLVIVE